MYHIIYIYGFIGLSVDLSVCTYAQVDMKLHFPRMTCDKCSCGRIYFFRNYELVDNVARNMKLGWSGAKLAADDIGAFPVM